MSSHRLPLLSDEVVQELGWTPYGWLLYLPSFWIAPILEKTPPHVWGATIVATLVFLALYFRGYWERGWSLTGIAAAIAGIGFLFFPANPGALVFFIYSGAFLGTLAPVRRAVISLFVLGALIAFQIAWFGLPWLLAVPAIGIMLLIGGTNIHFTEASRKNADLRRAHDEIERLAKVAERERIGRDLHDLLGHTLSVIVLKSELASKLAGRDPDAAVREIREVEEVSRQALREVRQAVRGYRREDGGGLAAEVENARQVLEGAGIRVEIDLALPADGLPGDAERAAALAVREGVTNVIRHARSSRCRVEVHRHEASLVTEVVDDGCGGRIEEGSGLRGMRERVESLGGSVRWNGDDGTRLSIRIPLPPPSGEVRA